LEYFKGKRRRGVEFTPYFGYLITQKSKGWHLSQSYFSLISYTMRVSLNKSFDVEQPASKVWEYLLDPYKVAECVPGVELTEKISETEYKGDVGIKLGPINASFDGEVTYAKVDETNKEIHLVGKGVDKKGKGSAEMTLEMRLTESGNVSTVDTTMNVNVIGVVAQFGSRLISDVSEHIFTQFVGNFQSLLAGGEIDEKDKQIQGGAVAGAVAKSIASGVASGVKGIFSKKDKGEKEEKKED